jgi:hypothetical protein
LVSGRVSIETLAAWRNDWASEALGPASGAITPILIVDLDESPGLLSPPSEQATSVSSPAAVPAVNVRRRYMVASRNGVGHRAGVVLGG